jgi:hypothetical protein
MILFPIDDHTGNMPPKAPKRTSSRPRPKKNQPKPTINQQTGNTGSASPISVPKRSWWSWPKFLALIIVGLALRFLFIAYTSALQYRTDRIEQNEVIIEDKYTYKVKVTASMLNVRQRPSPKAKVVIQMKYGQIAYANPSAVNGWMEITTSGGEQIGFSSAKYLTILYD